VGIAPDSTCLSLISFKLSALFIIFSAKFFFFFLNASARFIGSFIIKSAFVLLLIVKLSFSVVFDFSSLIVSLAEFFLFDISFLMSSFFEEIQFIHLSFNSSFSSFIDSSLIK